jgi:hypothetical protein
MCKLWKVVYLPISYSVYSLFLAPRDFKHDQGHAMAQAVSYCLSLQRPVFDTRPVYEGFVVEKGAIS